MMNIKSSPLERDRLIRRMAKGVGITVIAMLISRFLGYPIRIIMARSLTTEGYGQIHIALSMMTIIAMVGLLGLPTALTRQIAFFQAREEKANVIQTIRSGLGISVPVVIVLGLGVWGLADLLSRHVFHDPGLIPVLALIAFVIPFHALEQLMGAVLLGFQRIRIYNLLKNIVRFGITLSLLIFFFRFIQPTPSLAAWAYLLGYAFTVLLYLFACKDYFKDFIRVNHPNGATTKQLLSFSWPLVLNSLLWTLLPKTDILMLGYFMSSDIVGIYSAAVPMGELITLFSRAFLPMFIPLFTELISQHKNLDIRNLYRLATRWMTALSFPILIAVLVSPGHILNILFGSRYLDAAVPLQLLALGYFLPICMGPDNALLTSLGKSKMVMVNSIVVYGTNVCLNLVLIPILGIIGAATATAVSLIAHRLIALIEIFIITKNHPFDSRQIKTLLTGIISGALYFFLINRFAESYENIEVFLSILVGIAVLYGMLLFLLKTLNKDDLMIFKSIRIVLSGKK